MEKYKCNCLLLENGKIYLIVYYQKNGVMTDFDTVDAMHQRMFCSFPLHKLVSFENPQFLADFLNRADTPSIYLSG